MISNIKNKIDYRLLRQSFSYTFIWGIITHTFVFTNMVLSHDSLFEFYSDEMWTKANLGRFFYSVYITITRGRIVLPWIIGILGLCWISLSVYFMLRIFAWEKIWIIVFISGICVTNPTVYTLAATFIHDMDADLFAMMLSVISAFLWKKAIEKRKNRDRFFILFVGSIVLSVVMGIYQSYISVTITLIMFVSIRDILEEKDFSGILINGIYGIVMVFISAILYFIEVKIFSAITGFAMLENNSYNGLGTLSQLFSGNVLKKILGIYTNFFTAFENMILTSYPAKVFVAIPVILTVCMLGIVVYALKKCSWKNAFLMILLIALMPIGMNISYYLSNEMADELMQYAIWLIGLLCIIFVLWLKKANVKFKRVEKIVTGLMTVCVMLILFENVQTANTIYVEKELQYEAALSYMTRVADRMEEQEGYIPGETPVIFYGKNLGEPMEGFERYDIIRGIADGPITYYGTYEAYFEYVLGRPLLTTTNDDVKYSGEVYNMPAFPADGCMKIIEGILVVKMK